MKRTVTRIIAALMLTGFAVGSLTGCGSSAEPTEASATPTPLPNTDSVTVLDSGWSPDGDGNEEAIWSEAFTRRMPDGRTFTCFTFFHRNWTSTTQIWCDNADKPAR